MLCAEAWVTGAGSLRLGPSLGPADQKARRGGSEGLSGWWTGPLARGLVSGWGCVPSKGPMSSGCLKSAFVLSGWRMDPHLGRGGGQYGGKGPPLRTLRMAGCPLFPLDSSCCFVLEHGGNRKNLCSPFLFFGFLFSFCFLRQSPSWPGPPAQTSQVLLCPSFLQRLRSSPDLFQPLLLIFPSVSSNLVHFSPLVLMILSEWVLTALSLTSYTWAAGNQGPVCESARISWEESSLPGSPKT